MELKPLPQIDPPAYPTQDQLPAEKALEGNLPQRWQKAKGLAGALALFRAANATGCGSTADDGVTSHSGAAARANRPPAEFRQARNWVKAIYGGQPRCYPMGDLILPVPIKEDETGSIIKERQDH